MESEKEFEAYRDGVIKRYFLRDYKLWFVRPPALRACVCRYHNKLKLVLEDQQK